MAEKQLPDGWEWKSLGELCTHPQYGWTTSASKKGTIKLLRTTDISSGNIDWATVPFCLKNPPDIKKYLLKEGDILVSRAGSVGYSIEIKIAPKAVFASYLIRFKPNELTSPRYISLYLKSPCYWDSIAENTAGIAIPNVNATKLKQLKVPLAPLPEQHRLIAKIEQLLEKINNAKSNLDQVPSILKRLRQSILSAACTGKMIEEWRKKNPDIEPASKLLERIRQERIKQFENEVIKAKKEGRRPPKKPKNLELIKIDASDLSELPEGWEWVNINYLGEMSRGKSKHRPRNEPKLFGGKYPFIQTGDIAQSNGKITKYSQAYNDAGLKQSRLWPKGTLCITIAANIADTAILDFDACFPDSVVGFIADNRLTSEDYVAFFMKTAKANLEQFAPATAQKNINMGILNKVVIPLPPLEEQRIIVDQVSRLFDYIDSLEKRYEEATTNSTKIEQAILAKAFRGEL
jgi:type I restriction enzyme S subunit